MRRALLLSAAGVALIAAARATAGRLFLPPTLRTDA